MTLAVILLKASLLLLVVLLAYALLRTHLSATSRHLLWALAIVGLLLVPALHLVLPAWTVISVPPARAPEFARTAESAVRSIASDVTSSVPAPVNGSRWQMSPLRLAWPTLALTLYAIGVLGLLLRLLAQRWSIRRLAHRAARVTDPVWTVLLHDTARRLHLQRSIVLLRGLEETMPMAFGTRRPAILLPAVADTWSEEKRRSVLLHELAHVARNDCFTQSLAAVVCAIYWVHPGVWWIARRLRIERELACDDRVLAAGADADDYASHLLEFAHSLRVDTAPALAVTMAAPSSLEQRLRALLENGRNRQMPTHRSRFAVTAVGLLLAGAIATARVAEIAPLLQIQDPPRQSFEVASVKPNKSGETTSFLQPRPGGNFAVGNMTLRGLIFFAYGIQGFQLVGAPDWIATARFDITAKAPADIKPTPIGQISPEALMLRSLLEDRFRLAVHRETRDLPIYALVLARADGRLGPRLKQTTSDYCAKRLEAAGKAADTPIPPGSPVCGMLPGVTGNEITAGALPMNEFARFLNVNVGRTVVDRTGLTGVWDFDLKWLPPNAPSPDPDRPSIFTALQEQLGLRLDATTGPVEVLVIDRIEPLIPD